MVKTAVIFYSTYGHCYTMALSAVEGAKSVHGAEVSLYKVKETLPLEVLQKMGADKVAEKWKDVPEINSNDLIDKDVVIFITPTRFGMMCAQMKTFIDSLGGLWTKDTLVGKVASVMSSSGTQHGGQESTILSFHTVLLHLGFVLVGLPYSFKKQFGVEEVKGGSPYGASTIVGDGTRQVSSIEKEAAQYQAKHATEIGAKIHHK